MKAFDKTNDSFKAKKTHKSRFKLEHLKSETRYMYINKDEN